MWLCCSFKRLTNGSLLCEFGNYTFEMIPPHTLSFTGFSKGPFLLAKENESHPLETHAMIMPS
jgi:hypothetical protein